jgi:hypothetical protein
MISTLDEVANNKTPESLITLDRDVLDRDVFCSSSFQIGISLKEVERSAL